MIHREEYRHYRMALLYTSLLAVIVFSFLLVEGKDNSFLAINRSYNSAFDLLFRFYTYLGDGLIWIPLFIYALVYKKRFWIAIIASIIICTLLTQLFKRVVFPHEYRPMIILGEKIRMVQGVEMMRNNSFPSGHTSTAFTLALLLAFMIPGYFWVFFFPTVAFFVGYSRVYLAQHFVTDVAAGIIVGMISSYLSLLIWNYTRKKFFANDLFKPKDKKLV